MTSQISLQDLDTAANALLKVLTDAVEEYRTATSARETRVAKDKISSVKTMLHMIRVNAGH